MSSSNQENYSVSLRELFEYSKEFYSMGAIRDLCERKVLDSRLVGGEVFLTNECFSIMDNLKEKRMFVLYKQPHVVYLLTNTKNGKLYVGITNNLKKRLQSHKSDANRAEPQIRPIVRAVKKYGMDSFSVTILDDVLGVLAARELEKEHIKRLDTMTPIGYNITSGGEGVLNYVMSDLQKAAISERNKGSKNPNYGTGGVYGASRKRLKKRENPSNCVFSKPVEIGSIRYNSIEQAANSLNISRNNVKTIMEYLAGEQVYGLNPVEYGSVRAVNYSHLSVITNLSLDEIRTLRDKGIVKNSTFRLSAEELVQYYTTIRPKTERKPTNGKFKSIPIELFGVRYRSINSASKILKTNAKTIKKDIELGNGRYL